MSHLMDLLDPKVVEALRQLTVAQIDPEAPAKAPTEADVKSMLGQAHVAVAAARERRATEKAIHRPQVAKHQPRTSDGIDHPVTTTHKETSMTFDLSHFSTAQLAALAVQAREMLEVQAAADLPAKRDAAIVADQEAEAKAASEAKEAQAARKNSTPLAAFFVHRSLTVPALDLSDVEDLNLRVTAKVRSPYNKARSWLGEPTLPHSAEPGEPTTTYAMLAAEHIRLAAAVAAKHAEKAEAKPETKPEQVLVAEIDPTMLAAVMTARNCNEAEARAVLALLG